MQNILGQSLNAMGYTAGYAAQQAVQPKYGPELANGAMRYQNALDAANCANAYQSAYALAADGWPATRYRGSRYASKTRRTASMVVSVQFPKKLGFLFSRWRYKGLHSGRGAAKSWSVADALLMLGKDRTINGWRIEPGPVRVVCARETMKSLKDSSYRLLCDRIKELQLQEHYGVQRDIIRGKNGTEFIFTGLSDPQGIKSLEGADILWVEEAQVVSKHSWDTLVPTLRKEGIDAAGDWYSEIWVTWNPSLDTDETHMRLVVNPPTNSKVVALSWRDNPWFPKVLDVERRDCLRLNPADYGNTWEGETRSAVAGAIFAGELAAAASRICKVSRDRTKPVDTAWDLGYGDKTAVWFFQAIDGWYRMVDYEEGWG